VRWRRPVSFSWATPVILHGRVFVADAELKKPDATERLHCFDERTGKTLWMFAYNSKYPENAFVPGQGNGPTATPIAEANHVWMLGLNGEVHCLDVSSGTVAWEKPLNRDYKIQEMTCRASPLIEGNLLILFTGAKPGAGVIALDKHTGTEVWKALDEPVLNSSPIMITVAAKRQLIVWTGESVTALDPGTGATLWAERLITSSNDGTATPVFHGNRLLIGGLMLEFRDGARAPVILWPVDTKAVSKRVLSNTSTALFRDDHVYSALSRGQLVCLDAATGKELWQTDEVTKVKSGASISINPMGEDSCLFTDEGSLILARLTPAGYHEISRAPGIEPTTPFGGQNKAWTPPAYANGCVFLRNDNEVVCLSLK
jgi:outer membrane protein assembly factor BamB